MKEIQPKQPKHVSPYAKVCLDALVKESVQHFNKDEFENVYADIQEIIGADGQVDSSEAKALAALKQIIQLNVK